jgi:hypothetical protein
MKRFNLTVWIAWIFLLLPIARAGDGKVTLIRTPDGGIQPQAAMDERGVLHLIYFKGEPGAGNVFYVRREPGKESFSAPIQVNSQAGSVIAAGTVRGAHIAVGKRGRVHVAWMGSKNAVPTGPENSSPMLYARLNDEATAFEPQRNLIQFATGLDGGGSVAADNAGNVYVAWHAGPSKKGEEERRVWLARSRDEGRSFSREAPANSEPTGACGCCGMRAFADRDGKVYILYRSATQQIHRDIYLLASNAGGESFAGNRLHEWEINACPMSTAAFGRGANRVLAAWETKGQVYFAGVKVDGGSVSPPVSPPGESGKRKHAAIAGNGRGETLLAWAEGTAWNRGGSLAWQVFDKMGQPMAEKGSVPGIPVWSLPAVVEYPDGRFAIIY